MGGPGAVLLPRIPLHHLFGARLYAVRCAVRPEALWPGFRGRRCGRGAEAPRHPKAHIVGLSMGGFAAILFGIRHPEMATSLVPAGAGSGSPREDQAAFRAGCAARGDKLIAQGWPGELAEETGHSPTRIQLKKKDPRGWAAYMARLAQPFRPRHRPDHEALPGRAGFDLRLGGRTAEDGGRRPCWRWATRTGPASRPTSS